MGIREKSCFEKKKKKFKMCIYEETELEGETEIPLLKSVTKITGH